MLPINLSKIVEFLFRNIPKRFNVNQIARELKISVGSAYKILKSLHNNGILVSESIGSSIYYALNLENKETGNIVGLVLIDSRNKTLAENSFASIYAKDLKEAEKFSKAIILFGSVLDKKDAKDIDVLFIIDKGKAKRVEDFCLKLSNLRPKAVNPLLMTMADFRKNIKKQDEVITEILKKGIILSGEDAIVKTLRGI